MVRPRPTRRACLLGLGAPLAPAPRAATDVLAVVGVTLVDVAAGVGWPDTTVLVRGDTVAAVGPTAAVPVPPAARVLDGRGKHLIPGLWDMHAHVVDPGFYGLFLRAGVTGVRHMYGINPVFTPGEPADRAVGPVRPRIVRAAQAVDGPDTPFGRVDGWNVVRVGTPAAVPAALDQLQRGGADFVKVFSTLPRDVYRALVAAARARGLAVDGHVPGGVTAAEASAAGQRTVEHLDGVALGCSAAEPRLRAEWLAARPASAGDATGWRFQVRAHASFDPTRAAALFRVFAANGTWHVPTLVQTRQAARLAEPNPVPPSELAGVPALARVLWEREVRADGGVRLPRLGIGLTAADLAARAALFDGDRALVGRMHRAGVRVLAGTDTPNPFVVPGWALHDELELLVSAGLTPAAALRAATLDPARCLGLDGRLGSVGPGKQADLVLLGRDPLADVRNTRAVEVVVVGGRVAAGV